jgi:radical SAM protein with 4Fe4S-binding SPASM domain
LQAGLNLKLKTMVITLNQHELSGMLNFAKERNVEFRYDFNIHAANDQQKTPHNYRISPEQALLVDTIDPIRFDRLKQAWHANHSSPSSTDWSSLYHCGAGIKGFHINPYGMLSLCMVVSTPAYSLRTGSFREGWQTFLPQERFRPMPAASPCTTCALYPVCNQCPGMAVLENDNPTQPVPFLCQVSHLREDTFSKSLEKGEI